MAITNSVTINVGSNGDWQLRGHSRSGKPLHTDPGWERMPNGTSLLWYDTGQVFFYDRDEAKWYEM